MIERAAERERGRSDDRRMEVRSSRGTKSVKEGRAAEGPVQPNMGRERGGGGRRERESRGTDWVEKRIYTQYVL